MTTEFDVEARFKLTAASGDPTLGLALLDKLDRAFDARYGRRKRISRILRGKSTQPKRVQSSTAS